MRSVANFQPRLFERSETKNGELRAFANPSSYQAALAQNIEHLIRYISFEKFVCREFTQAIQQAESFFHLNTKKVSI